MFFLDNNVTREYFEDLMAYAKDVLRLSPESIINFFAGNSDGQLKYYDADNNKHKVIEVSFQDTATLICSFNDSDICNFSSLYFHVPTSLSKSIEYFDENYSYDKKHGAWKWGDDIYIKIKVDEDDLVFVFLPEEKLLRRIK